ncbi:phosphatidylinositol glycan anchor biosynthesis class U protein-like [Chenopodium quinoa]|uniref:phosphatidylinositol glycan anchor biosynthesis class U protein-like n=1 Tax=Chenopodium quinoa TaxID=63459 RepID=UPI000B7704D5|nr:phosphatidylinositol glycan anchor biosynthesis class U protein-like [Chenopodium quinoa]
MGEDENNAKSSTTKTEVKRFWEWAIAAIIFRFILIFVFPDNLAQLASRPEVSTPVTSLRRLAEGYWLKKQASISPYAGSMYHGSPLLLSVLGPLTVQKINGLSSHILCSLLFVIADFIAALLLRATGKKLQSAYSQSLKALSLDKILGTSEIYASGDISALFYLWNPLTILTCVGSSTSPIENLLVILSIYGACMRLIPLAAVGWVLATHISLYPAVLVIPVILLLGYGPDAPPKKLFLQKISRHSANNSGDSSLQHVKLKSGSALPSFTWKPVILFLLWASAWSVYILVLCGISVGLNGGLQEMFKRTYGFILTVEDLSPNIGVLWYFFAEVFDFFRNFFLLVIHMNILFMILPLAIRMKHRPCFLAFVYVAIYSMLKTYPSVADSALYIGLFGLFINQLAEMHFSFVLFCGYVGVNLLSPVMHNLWIWRGTGNANFYYATAIAYAALQIVLVVDSASAMLNHDRWLGKLITTES